MSCRLGWKTASGRHSSHKATNSSRMSWRCSGNVRTSKSCTVRFSGAMPSSAVAALTSPASVSGGNPSGNERVAIENATYRTCEPASTSRAIVPPAPNSPSSVCGARTSTRSQAPITRPFLSRRPEGTACGAVFRTRRLLPARPSERAVEPLEPTASAVGFGFMPHGNLAQVAAVVGAASSVLVLVPRRRVLLIAGFIALAAAEGMLAVALIPRSDLERLVHRPVLLAGLGVAGLAVLGLAAALVRRPALMPIALLLAAPFRIPVNLGSQHAFLLLPFYAVLASAARGCCWGLVGAEPRGITRLLAGPVAAFIGLSAVSLLWSQDLQQG